VNPTHTVGGRAKKRLAEFTVARASRPMGIEWYEPVTVRAKTNHIDATGVLTRNAIPGRIGPQCFDTASVM